MGGLQDTCCKALIGQRFGNLSRDEYQVLADVVTAGKDSLQDTFYKLLIGQGSDRLSSNGDQNPAYTVADYLHHVLQGVNWPRFWQPLEQHRSSCCRCCYRRMRSAEVVTYKTHFSRR